MAGGDDDHRARVEREVREEIAAHLENLEARLVEEGMSREAAREEALRRFGDPQRAFRDGRRVRLRRARKTRRRELWSGTIHDLVSAWRAVRGRPVFSLTAMLMLAVGCGSAVATFSVMKAVLLTPLPFTEPDHLFQLDQTVATLNENGLDSPEDVLDWRYRVADAFSGLALFHPLGQQVNVRAGGEPLRAIATEVSGDFFDVLGAPFVRGRGFAPSDLEEPAPAAAIVSERFWRSRLGGDEGLPGASIDINGRGYRVVGVVSTAAELSAEIDVWVPLAFGEPRIVRGARFFRVLARTHAGVSGEQAAAAVQRLHEWLQERFGDSNYGRMQPKIHPLRDVLVSNVRTPIWLLFGATGLVLAITVANLGGYLLTRARARRSEYAVRAALGAGARRLLTQSLGEALILAAGGAVGGVLLARACIGLLRASPALGLPRTGSVMIDGPVLAFALLLTTLTTLGAGMAPGVAAVRASGAIASSRVLGSPGSDRVRDALLVLQVALALVLAVAAALLGRSWSSLLGVDAGFGDSTLSFSVVLDDVAYPSADAKERFAESLLAELRRDSRVDRAGASASLPMSGNAMYGLRLSFPDDPADDEPRFGIYVPVWTGTLEAMGMRMIAGRPLADADAERGSQGIVINRALRDSFLGGREALGTRIHVLDRDFAVVGVVESVHNFTLRDDPLPTFYVPGSLVHATPRYFLVHGHGLRFADLADLARTAVRSVDPELPVSDVRTMGELRRGALATPGLLAALFAGFSALGLGLAAFGLYAVLTQWAVARTTETGLRMALGASREQVVLEFLRRGAARCVLGLLVGAGLYVATGRWLESQLFGVRTYDPATLGAVGGLLIAVWLLAMFLPARRASQLDPARALRSE